MTIAEKREINEARKPELIKNNWRHDGFIYKNYNYTLGLVINRKFFDNDSTFQKTRANRKGADWEGMKEKIDKNRHIEKQGNFAFAFWGDNEYVIVGNANQSDGYLSKLNQHLTREYSDYKADMISNFSFNAKGEPVLGDEFKVK